MFNSYLTKTATVKRLGTTTKTERAYSTVSATTFTVSEPQTRNRMDLVQGMHVTDYVFYADYDSTIRKGDTMTVDSKDYLVLASEPYKVKNIEFRKIITSRDNE